MIQGPVSYWYWGVNDYSESTLIISKSGSSSCVGMLICRRTHVFDLSFLFNLFRVSLRSEISFSSCAFSLKSRLMSRSLFSSDNLNSSIMIGELILIVRHLCLNRSLPLFAPASDFRYQLFHRHGCGGILLITSLLGPGDGSRLQLFVE